MENLYESADKSVTLLYDSQKHYFVQVGIGDVPDKFYKKIHNVFLDYVKERQCKNVVYDLSNQTRTDLSSRAWFAAIYTPKAFKELGSNFNVAIVKSKNKFENTSTELLVKAAQGLGMKGTIHFFDDPQSAHDWMEAQSLGSIA